MQRKVQEGRGFWYDVYVTKISVTGKRSGDLP